MVRNWATAGDSPNSNPSYSHVKKTGWVGGFVESQPYSETKLFHFLLDVCFLLVKSS